MSGAKVVTFYLITNSYRLKSSFNFNVIGHLTTS
jgi:ribosomal protein S25